MTLDEINAIWNTEITEDEYIEILKRSPSFSISLSKQKEILKPEKHRIRNKTTRTII